MRAPFHMSKAAPPGQLSPVSTALLPSAASMLPPRRGLQLPQCLGTGVVPSAPAGQRCQQVARTALLPPPASSSCWPSACLASYPSCTLPSTMWLLVGGQALFRAQPRDPILLNGIFRPRDPR